MTAAQRKSVSDVAMLHGWIDVLDTVLWREKPVYVLEDTYRCHHMCPPTLDVRPVVYLQKRRFLAGLPCEHIVYVGRCGKCATAFLVEYAEGVLEEATQIASIG